MPAREGQSPPMKLYKIIQLLRLSRLVLLVILLLFAVAAKIARAESAYIWLAGNKHAGSPLEVCKAAFEDAARKIVEAIPKGNGDYGDCIFYNAAGYKPLAGHYSRVLKTCDAKELTNPNPPFGYESLKDLFILKAPQGDDAALWFPDKFSSCENNCVVRNTRYYTKGKDGVPKASVTEADGSSRSVFYKRQTGEVCVPEKPKKNDPPKPPAPDNDNGGSQGNSGSDNGQGNQSNGSGGESSSGGTGSGSGSTSNQGSGNSNEGGSGSGGSGSGSGGVNGSGGQTGPSGGGTSGGESGGNESEGSEGEAGGESDGSGEESGGSGDSGGQGSSDGSGEGPVGNGQSGGTGEGDGQGSISGGSCEANQAPQCKGDPIQCYIAREQWRTACAATGQNSKVEGNGNCRTQTPPECKGDATQCYIVKQQFLEGCARQSLEEYGREQAGNAQSYTEGDGFDSIGDAIGDNDSIVNVPSQLNTSGYGLTRTCPTLQFDIDVALFGSFRLDFSILCGLANLLGNLFVVASLVISARYILR